MNVDANVRQAMLVTTVRNVRAIMVMEVAMVTKTRATCVARSVLEAAAACGVRAISSPSIVQVAAMDVLSEITLKTRSWACACTWATTQTDRYRARDTGHLASTCRKHFALIHHIVDGLCM